MSRTGRFAAITNYRSGPDARRDAPSRGGLVVGFLAGTASPPEYLATVAARGEQYNGFSLLAGHRDRLGWYSNRGDLPDSLEPGLYGLSNALLDTPWPKVTRVKDALHRLLSSGSWDPQALLAVLTESHPALDGELPSTGVGLERERELSPLFIEGEHYGTRSSTVLTIDREGCVELVERTHLPGRKGVSTASFQFEVRGQRCREQITGNRKQETGGD